MTEQEWLTGAKGVALVKYWEKQLTDRKARLLMLACCLSNESRFEDSSSHEATRAIAAHYADPVAPEAPYDGDHLRALYRRVERYASNQPRGPARGVAFGVLAAVETQSIAQRLGETLPYLVYSCLADIANNIDPVNGGKESAVQADLVREIIGNPFRPVMVNPEWRTDTVMTLARQMYVTNEFSAMPILADALQDAGCDSDDILNHCRDTALKHVRGCWVLDLLFGKT